MIGYLAYLIILFKGQLNLLIAIRVVGVHNPWPGIGGGVGELNTIED